MSKRYYLMFLIVSLIFILIPYSFALDSNITDNNEIMGDISDNNLLENDDLSIVVHVDTEGSDNNPGSDTKPVATISKALNLSSNHGKIIIHEGIYKENNLNITKSLDIISQGEVIIDAENSSRIFTINTNTSDEVVLSGITFINGRAYQGGAIYIRNAITTIENSRFLNNTALTEGGAIYWNAPYGKLINTTFLENIGRDGAAVSWGGVNASEDIFGVKSDYGEIINCIFENNHLTLDEDACIGLSIYSDEVKVINSTFKNHDAKYNSSFEVLYINGDNAWVSGCLFINNSMTMAGALGLDGNFAEVHGNTFINNSMSFPDSFGGAIGIQSENANVDNNTFISNGGLDGVGGAIFINTIETFSFNFINITNNRFIDNYAYYGGGIYATGKSNMLSLRIIANSFDGENANSAGGIYLADIYNPVVIENNTFSNLISDDNYFIYATHCILQLSGNLVENSSSSGVIFTDGEIRSQVYLNFNDVVAIASKPATLTADLFDDMNNSIETNIIGFTVNGENLAGRKAINSINYTFTTLGEYVISGSFNSPKVTIQNGNLTVLKGAKLDISDLVCYGRNVDINVGLTDANDIPISEAKVILNLDNSNYLLITDANGKGHLNIDLDFKTYNMTARFDSNDYYTDSVSSTLTVLPSINAGDMNRAYKSGCDFKAQFFNKDGNPLKNTDVVFNVNNQDFTVKTDSNGTAVLSSNLTAGSYIVTVTNPVSGDTVSKNLNIVERLRENSDVKMYFGAGKSYQVRVYGDDGNVSAAGEAVIFKVNGNTYTRYADANGYASLKITLPANTYAVTATYRGVSVSNKIVVKPVLTAKNISKKKAKTIKFSAKLLNSNGKVVKGKKITFKINKKTYKAKTNKKGVATVSLKNLKVGKHTITVKYDKSTIKKTIKVKK